MANIHSKLMGLLQRAPYIRCEDVYRQYAVNWLMNNGVTVQKWIPVTERLPKANRLVLCWWQSGDGEREHYGFARYQTHGVWYVSNEGMPNVTHWMPLPEPPGEQNEATAD